MGLQAVMNALHQKNGMRVDIEYNEDTQLDVWKSTNADHHFEIYPSLGISFISENIPQARKYAEATFQALAQNHYARNLQELLHHCTDKDAGKTIWFENYSSDTRSLCSFIEKYFSFVEPESSR